MQEFIENKAGSIDAQPTSVSGDTTSSVPALFFRGESRQQQLRKYNRNLKRDQRLVKNTKSYFVCKGGYVTHVSNAQEIVVPCVIKNGEPFVYLKERGEVQLIYIMLDAYDIKYTPDDRIKYKVNFMGHIELSSIKIINVKPKDFSTVDISLIEKFKCATKAQSSNGRASGIISAIEVYNSLRHFEFRCFYCKQKLDHNTWNLDHYIPISKKGKNIFENIVPACSICNKMKSDLMPDQFIKMCQLIIDKNSIYRGN